MKTVIMKRICDNIDDLIRNRVGYVESIDRQDLPDGSKDPRRTQYRVKGIKVNA